MLCDGAADWGELLVGCHNVEVWVFKATIVGALPVSQDLIVPQAAFVQPIHTFVQPIHTRHTQHPLVHSQHLRQACDAASATLRGLRFGVYASGGSHLGALPAASWQGRLQVLEELC